MALSFMIKRRKWLGGAIVYYWSLMDEGHTIGVSVDRFESETECRRQIAQVKKVSNYTRVEKDDEVEEGG